MSRLTEVHLQAFNDELEKTAWSMKPGTLLHRALGGAGAGAGIGGTLGALGGGTYGAIRGYRDTKEQGGSTGSALWTGLGEGVGGALRGGAVGAAAGGLLGSGVGALANAQSYSNTMRGVADSGFGGAAHAGQRMVHGVTGWAPEKGIASIGGGSADAAARLRTAEEAASKLPMGPHQAKSPLATHAADTVKELESATSGLAAAQKAENMGLTSIPGWLGSVRNNGLAATVGADLADSWHSGGALHKGLLMGVPTALGAYELHQASQPTEPGGPGKAERYGLALGHIAGGLTGGSMPVLGNMVWGEGLAHAGKYTGRLVDKGRAMHGKLVTPQPQSDSGQHVPAERIQSPSSLGMPNEGVQ